MFKKYGGNQSGIYIIFFLLYVLLTFSRFIMAAKAQPLHLYSRQQQGKMEKYLYIKKLELNKKQVPSISSYIHLVKY